MVIRSSQTGSIDDTEWEYLDDSFDIHGRVDESTDRLWPDDERTFLLVPSVIYHVKVDISRLTGSLFTYSPVGSRILLQSLYRMPY
jgi:hypothetical protein